ncbi:CubicO group peptidase, beta-lactamase class C family [Mucilaginibacter lappiensis]|uniref:CubicO group peptidase (Beta-lactamase class C family) n=1 Tax=Mucilaginibacter lappiensis TaxID=354630 RepID=A0ABR6PEW1_9SPHI|nr:serine hydrolase [Mucilaginibacter lappiensis]MBB6108273.1 CubicO group peptidase (beta-lactamase class C family) [Mucilaginibacter lappiensis]SIQ44551.1 CubicO group peptidase, beta-lactamase class C family [Mucilaginibacter lappiensis]
MIKNKWGCIPLVLFGFTFLNTACAQIPPAIPAGQAYVNEERLVEHSTVLFNNIKYLLPLQNLDQLKIASVHFSSSYASVFDSLLNKYSKVQAFDGRIYSGAKNLTNLSADLKWYNTIILQVTDTDLNNPQIVDFINSTQKLKNVIVAAFGGGTVLTKLNNVTAPVLWSERLTPVAALYSAQAIFGGLPVTQKLTRTYSPQFAAGMGFITDKIRLQYTVPEDAGINASNLTGIDDIAREAIAEHATPGCVVLVAKDGKVIFNKAYGYHTYDKAIPDQITDIFDLASMTKVTATTVEAMKLTDEGKLNLEATVGDYLPQTRSSNKNDIQIRELLMHQAGLIPDIKGFEKVKPADHSTDSSAAYPIRVSDHYFLRKDYYKDVMFPDILNSPLKTRGQYVYSDVGLVLMMEVVESITAIPENVYVQQAFYKPLGMQTAGFLPLYRFNQNQIPPTENDQEYRQSLLDGYVHDPTAALMGGVAGHAGLFASANDVAILYQMLLNRGTYGGNQYFKPEVVDLFTSKQSAVSRRGLGFDRWDPIADRHYPSKLASPQTFGHTGFTGTCIWVDPKYNLVYVFLSNRVYPNVSNKLGSLNIRPRIQDVVYDAITKGM